MFFLAQFDDVAAHGHAHGICCGHGLAGVHGAPGIGVDDGLFLEVVTNDEACVATAALGQGDFLLVDADHDQPDDG